MLRRLLSLAAAVSSVLCIALVVLWVRSYFVGEVWHLSQSARTDATTSPWGAADTWCYRYSVHSGRGRVQWVRREVQETTAPDDPGRKHVPPAEAVSDLNGGITRSDRWFNTLGFGYFSRDKQYFQRPPVQGSYWGFRVLTLPYWFLALVSGLPPAAWATAWRRRRRRRIRLERRHCTRCGYDLRATAERCPECGEAVQGRNPNDETRITNQ